MPFKDRADKAKWQREYMRDYRKTHKTPVRPKQQLMSKRAIKRLRHQHGIPTTPAIDFGITHTAGNQSELDADGQPIPEM